MKKDDFMAIYNEFKSKWQVGQTDVQGTKDVWDVYKNRIIGGLPFETDADVSWVKSSDNDNCYLPRFIDQMKLFGRARIGNFEQVMIYKNTGKGVKNGQYFDGYINITSKKSRYSNDKQQAEKDYGENVKKLLEKIVGAKTIGDLYEVEQSDRYKGFRAKQFLRKLSVLNSVFNDDVDYKNQLLWIYSDSVINNLVDIFEIDNLSDATFFQKSKKVLEKVVEWLDWQDDSKERELPKLNKINELLWSMGTLNINELTNFNTPNIIYHGAPGTGKTYTTLQSVRMLCYGDGKRYKYCQFHPSYSYQDFIEGIKPMGITNGNVNLEVVNGVFKQFCIHVREENEKSYKTCENNYDDYPHYYFIVDEINRGDLSRIFGEIFSLLEPDYRDKDFSGNYKTSDNLILTPLSTIIKASKNKDLTYKEIDGEPYFGIPFNIHFIGLMNDVDKSIDTFDLALRRRFKWVAKHCDYDVIQDYIDDTKVAEEYRKACENLNDFICNKETGLGLSKNYQLGQSYFMRLDRSTKATNLTAGKEKVFNNYIETTLREYAREICDEQEIDEKIKAAKGVFIPEKVKNNSNDKTRDGNEESDDE